MVAGLEVLEGRLVVGCAVGIELLLMGYFLCGKSGLYRATSLREPLLSRSTCPRGTIGTELPDTTEMREPWG